MSEKDIGLLNLMLEHSDIQFHLNCGELHACFRKKLGHISC